MIRVSLLRNVVYTNWTFDHYLLTLNSLTFYMYCIFDLAVLCFSVIVITYQRLKENF